MTQKPKDVNELVENLRRSIKVDRMFEFLTSPPHPKTKISRNRMPDRMKWEGSERQTFINAVNIYQHSINKRHIDFKVPSDASWGLLIEKLKGWSGK